jgi:hypothetical protein
VSPEALESGKLKWIPNETSGPVRDKPAPGHRPSRCAVKKDNILNLMIIGTIVGLSSILLMRVVNNQFWFIGPLMLIIGGYLVKKGREQMTGKGQ